ncbi:MAG: hypothetical protein LBO77_00745 [Desulfovibrio sp.]|jgi:hypothetical protein|nr:hypothetical protein [Desulfovibrio sp.]
MAGNKETAAGRKKKPAAPPPRKPPAPADIVNQARGYAPACILALAEEVANSEGQCRVKAAISLLDRAFGKVGQQIEVTGKIEVDLAERIRRGWERVHDEGK